MKEIIESVHDAHMVETNRDRYLRMHPDERRRLLDALGEMGREDAGRLLSFILPEETDKGLQKIIRKHIFLLKTKGIRVEESRAGGEPVLRKIEEKREYKGFMSSYDDEGARVVIDAFEVKRNNFIFVNAVIHLFDGLTDLRLAPVTRQGFDAIIAEYRKGATQSVVFVEISPRYAAFLIEESDSRTHRFQQDVGQLKQFASALKDAVQKPEDLYGLALPIGVEAVSTDAVLSHDIFKPLTVVWDTLEADKATFRGLGESTILLPQHMIEEKKEAFLDTLIESGPLAPRVHAIKRMLEDYAFIFFTTGQFDYYNGLINLLRDDAGPRGVLAFFARKSLDTVETKGEPGLIAGPYE